MGASMRKAAVAGTWYPGTRERLADEVDGYLDAASPAAITGRLVALVSPHAGLRYSGRVAAHGYRLLHGRQQLRVVLVGPSHRAAFDGVALDASRGWETPLGVAPRDETIAEALLAGGASCVFEDSAVHREEHSLEMQMPFLQRLVPSLQIVPLVMGRQSRAEIDSLAAALAAALRGQDVLLVASSDLSHYQPAAVANRLDAAVVDDVSRFDDESLLARLESRPNVACGGGPMVAVMKAARALGADRGMVLKYGDSGDVEGRDKSQVVGYLSAALMVSAS